MMLLHTPGHTLEFLTEGRGKFLARCYRNGWWILREYPRQGIVQAWCNGRLMGSHYNYVRTSCNTTLITY